MWKNVKRDPRRPAGVASPFCDTPATSPCRRVGRRASPMAEDDRVDRRHTTDIAPDHTPPMQAVASAGIHAVNAIVTEWLNRDRHTPDFMVQRPLEPGNKFFGGQE